MNKNNLNKIKKKKINKYKQTKKQSIFVIFHHQKIEFVNFFKFHEILLKVNYLVTGFEFSNDICLDSYDNLYSIYFLYLIFLYQA